MRSFKFRFAADPQARERTCATADFVAAVLPILADIYLDDAPTGGSKLGRHHRDVEKAAVLKTIRLCCPLAQSDLLQIFAKCAIEVIDGDDDSTTQKVNKLTALTVTGVWEMLSLSR